MIEIVETVEQLGRLGLLERLTESQCKEGLDNFDLISSLDGSAGQRSVYIGDDYVPKIEVYNALGAIYPLLSREKKLYGLQSILRKMDGVRYDRVSMNHTPYIRDPQFLSDIGASRGLYWPGLYDEEKLWNEETDFKKFREKNMDEKGLFRADRVNSDFLVSYAILRSDFSKFGESYAEVANPGFLKRVLKGIVTLRFSGCKNEEEIEGGRKRLQEFLPSSVHDKIEPLRNEANWVIHKEVVM